MFDCPDCGASHDTLEGVAMHYVNMESGHTEYTSKQSVKDAVRTDSASNSGGSSDDSDDSTESQRQKPPFDSVNDMDGTSDDSEGAVNDSLIPLEPGRPVWVTNEQGQKGRLAAEEGDKIDPERAVLIESDGTEWDICTAKNE